MTYKNNGWKNVVSKEFSLEQIKQIKSKAHLQET